MKPLAWFGCLCAAIVVATPAQGVAINATGRGYYDASSVLNPNDNYRVGEDAGAAFNNFFVFDLGGQSGTIISAELRLFNPPVAARSPPPTPRGGFFSADVAGETYEVHAVTVSPETLILGTGGSATFTDLGDGADGLYGTYPATLAASNGTFITIDVSAAIADMQGEVGNGVGNGLFAFGGSITTLVSTDDQYLFGFTLGVPLSDTQLIVTFAPAVAPEPHALALLGLGALGLAFSLRRRRIR